MTLAIVAFVCALGAHLTVGGIPTIRLPWRVTEHLPLVRLALPTRFVVYTGAGGRRAGVAVARRSGRAARGAGR